MNQHHFRRPSETRWHSGTFHPIGIARSAPLKWVIPRRPISPALSRCHPLSIGPEIRLCTVLFYPCWLGTVRSSPRPPLPSIVFFPILCFLSDLIATRRRPTCSSVEPMTAVGSAARCAISDLAGCWSASGFPSSPPSCSRHEGAVTLAINRRLVGELESPSQRGPLGYLNPFFAHRASRRNLALAWHLSSFASSGLALYGAVVLGRKGPILKL